MKNKPKKEKVKASDISTIVDANMGKRLLTAIIDALFFCFIAVAAALWVFKPIVNAGLKYEETQVELTQYQVASHLYVYRQADDDGNYYPIEVKDYTEKINKSKSYNVLPLYQLNMDYSYYLEHVYYYYHSYLTNVDVELPNPTSTKTYDPVLDHFVSPHYNDPINGILPNDYYSDAWIMQNVLGFHEGESTYFIYTEGEGSFLNKISLKEGINSDELIKFLKQACYNATSDLYHSNYYTAGNDKIKWSQIAIVVPAVVLSYSIFYILVPLLYKNGETLGKKFFKLAIISSNGFQVKRRQIIFRQIIFFLMLALSSVVVGIGLTSLATLGVGLVILLVATLLSKEHRAPHDYAAMTRVVDAAKSVWFDSYEDEQKHAQELEEKMAKYKNKQIIDKKVIQVGTTIINEEVKKEFEESKKKSTKDE